MTENELYHHGVKGMHWGIRRYQNKNGTLTSAGRKKLADYKEKQTAKSDAKWDKRLDKSSNKASKYLAKSAYALARHKDEKAAKYDRKYAVAQTSNKYQQAMKTSEKEAIQKLSYKGMQHEKVTRGASAAANALASIGSLSLYALGISPVGVVTVPNTNKINTDMRVSKEKQKRIKKNLG